MPSPLIRRALSTILLSILASDALAAQTVRGTVTDRNAGRPISGALVQLLDLQGQPGTGVLTNASGAFTLTAHSAGRFRIRVERIGFRSELSQVLELAPGAVVDYPMVISSAPVSLEGITARGQSRGCSIRDGGETVVRVWEEARKALNALALSQSAELVHFDTEWFRREIDPRTRAVHTEQRRSAFGKTGNPFRSIPVEDLEAKGYLREFADSTVYYGPDAQVLLSDPFLDTHCFRLEMASSADGDLIGLGFRPARRPSRPDIEGTLWLDRKTSALRYVEYHYVGHGLDIPADRIGGRTEFEVVPASGAWFVRRWVIRMPVAVVRRYRYGNPGQFGAEERVETEVTALVEEGGEVVEVSTGPSGQGSIGVAALSGIVMDSLTDRPLTGAVVFLSGTAHADTTDASGHYRISGVPAGRYVVSFMHPKLRALGIIPNARRIEVAPPSPAIVDLAIPSEATLLQRHCAVIEPKDSGLLVGFLTNARTGAPVPGAHIRVGWSESVGVRPGSMTRSVTPAGEVKVDVAGVSVSATRGEVAVTTDEGGFYRVCGVPIDALLELQARVGDAISRRSVRLDGDRVEAQDLSIEIP